MPPREPFDNVRVVLEANGRLASSPLLAYTYTRYMVQALFHDHAHPNAITCHKDSNSCSPMRLFGHRCSKDDGSLMMEISAADEHVAGVMFNFLR